MKKMLISTLIAMVSSSLLAEGIGIQTSGSPTCPMGGKFYGYRSSGQGPGDTSFDEARILAEKNHVLLFIVWGKDGCATCSQYITNLDAWSRAAPKMLSYKNSVNAYFRGRSDGTGPAACVACYDFLRDTVGASGNCHIMAAYGVCEDGTVYKKSCSLITDYTTSGQKKVAWCDEFEALKEKHKYTPPKTDVVFECGETKTTRLEATPETERVFVPFIRTNNINRAAHYQLKIKFANGQPLNLDMDWASGQKRAEVDLYMTGRYEQDAKLQLVIVNEQGEETLTNHLYCVDSKANSFSYPFLTGEKGAYAFGDWTMDFDLAVNAVHAANSFQFPDTNQTPVKVTRSYPQDWSTSNRYETVYSADLEDFPKEVVEFSWEFPLVASNVVTTVHTNDLELIGKAREDVPFETKFEFEYTNTVTTIYMAPTTVLPSATTNPVERIESVADVTNRCEYIVKEGGEPELWNVAVDDCEFTVTGTNITLYAVDPEKAGQSTVVTNVGTTVFAVAGVGAFYNASKTVEDKAVVNFPTNLAMQCKYTVMPGNEGAATNLVFSVPVYTNFTLEVGSTVELLVSKECGTVVKYTGEVKDTVRVPDTATYYTAVSNDFEAIEKEFEFWETNRVYYTFNRGTTTNADESAIVPVSTNGAAFVTNFTKTVYQVSPVEREVTYGDYRQNIFTMKVTDSYADVETNVYQHGTAEGWARSGLPPQSFALKVTGSSVWDAKTIAFKRVFDDERFREWCVSNHIATVLVETAEPETGASLFSHAVASNKTSGTPYISSKGISVLDISELKGEGFKVELVRPDGVIAGALTPQFNADGTCDVAENMKRLVEFVMLDKACDLPTEPTEPTNNEAATTTLTVEFDGEQTPMHSVQISDRHDFFAIEGLKPGVPFQVCLEYFKDKSATQNQPYFEVVGACRQLTTNVWVASAEQIAGGLYVDVSGWDGAAATTGTFGGNTVMYYALTVRTAPVNKGVVGFDGDLVRVEEVGGEEQLPITVYRTGYTGTASATITLDRLETTVPDEYYTWKDQTINWADNVSGTQTVYVTVRDVNWATDVSNLVFTVAAKGAGLETARSRLTIDISQEIDPDALTGSVAITAPSTETKNYVVANAEVEIELSRFGGRRETSTRDEARGEVTATLTTTFGTLETDSVSWAQYRTGGKSLTLKVDDLGKLASKEFRVTMKAVDADGANVAVPSSNTVTFVVIPSDSAKFLSDLDKTVVQYVAVDETVALESIPLGMTVVSLSKISGTTPAGLTFTLDKAKGAIRIAGTPTKEGTYESSWWIRLRRLDNSYAYTMPVTVKFTIKPLGSSGGGCCEEPVNPSFAAARSWTGLPVLATDAARMVGTLDMTMSKTGSFSARYRRVDGKTVAFSARALSTVDVDTGLATTEATRRLSGIDYALAAEFAADGGVRVVIRDPAHDEVLQVTIAAGAKVWSKDNSASDWEGNYVAAFGLGSVTNENTLCLGPVVLRLKFDSPSQWNTGKVSYQGYLPNGKAISGSASLTPIVKGDTETALAILFANPNDAFSALPTLDTDGRVTLDPKGVIPNWKHVESSRKEASYENDYPLLSAGLWDKGGRTAYSGRVTGTDGETLTYTVNRTSGLVSGTYRNSGSGISSAAYRGIALGETLIIGGYSYNLWMPEWGKTIKKGDALAIEE